MSDLKTDLLLNTLVFETLGEPSREREFKLKSLKKWGFDLLFGKKEGVETFFTSPLDTRKSGDKYEEEEIGYEVTEVLKELPKNKKVFAHIEMMEGTAFLCVDLRDKENLEILRVPAGEILLAFLKKHKFVHLINSLKNLGSAALLLKHHGLEGKPLPFQELPPVARRFLRESKKIEKEMGFGRVALSYFGEDKDKKARFWLEWMVPTISLFDEHISQKIDKVLAELK